jgi:hypothetical protein
MLDYTIIAEQMLAMQAFKHFLWEPFETAETFDLN